MNRDASVSFNSYFIQGDLKFKISLNNGPRHGLQCVRFGMEVMTRVIEWIELSVIPWISCCLIQVDIGIKGLTLSYLLISDESNCLTLGAIIGGSL